VGSGKRNQVVIPSTLVPYPTYFRLTWVQYKEGHVTVLNITAHVCTILPTAPHIENVTFICGNYCGVDIPCVLRNANSMVSHTCVVELLLPT